MPKSNYLKLNRSLIILTITSFLSLIIYFYNDSNFIKSIQKVWINAKEVITKPKNELDNFIQYRSEWHSKILDILKAEFQSNDNHYPRNDAIESIIENKLDFIKIKDRQIDLISNEFVFGNILFRENSQVLNTVLINIGSNDFSYQDSRNKKFIVIDVNGNLVGRITSLGNNSSIVQLVNDVNNKVIVEDKKNMLKSALMVPISYNKGQLYGVTRQDSISLGDTLYTSTKSDVYIDRIPVCKVIKVGENLNQDPFRNVIVELLSDLSRINFIIVVGSDKNSVFDKGVNND